MWENEKIPLPHSRVYTRLGATSNGIGVYAIVDIPPKTNIFSNDDFEMVWIDKSLIENLNQNLKRLYQDFCVLKGDTYGCPKNFNMLTVGWYLNHNPLNPNVICDDNFDFYTDRFIAEGDELTVDYSNFSDDYRNDLEVNNL